MDYNLLATALILILCAMIHEIMHGYTAYYLGDVTARDAGRLSWNPIRHIDIVGSLIVPAFLMYVKTGYIFAWAKPVPFDTEKLEDKKWGAAFVGVAGPATNIILALFGGVLIRFSKPFGIAGHPILLGIIVTFIVLNLVLAFFNLIPLPPLDGHHVSFALMGDRFSKLKDILQSYWPFFLIPCMVLIWKFSGPVIETMFSIVVGAASL